MYLRGPSDFCVMRQLLALLLDTKYQSLIETQLFFFRMNLEIKYIFLKEKHTFL